MDGVFRCSRYSFGPNRLHYCGPDAHHEMKAYLKEGVSDPGLSLILKQFDTLYKYLSLIARANHIADPFDNKVVEAYWIGNEFLEAVEKTALYRHLIDDHKLKKKISLKSFEEVENKIRQGAVPHHSFHVLNVWRRTGHLDREHTLESMDECRISWGKVLKIDGPIITVETEPLILENSKLALGKPIMRKITRHLETDMDIDLLKPKDIVTIHWGVPCEVITPKQALVLKKYTLQNIEFANQTI